MAWDAGGKSYKTSARAAYYLAEVIESVSMVYLEFGWPGLGPELDPVAFLLNAMVQIHPSKNKNSRKLMKYQSL